MTLFNREDDPGNAPSAELPDAPVPVGDVTPATAPPIGTFWLAVRVHDARTAAPIAGALVTTHFVDPPASLPTTNAAGVVTFAASVGDYHFEISALGYKVESFTVHIDGPRTLDVALFGPGPAATPEIPPAPPRPSSVGRAPVTPGGDVTPPGASVIALDPPAPASTPPIGAVQYDTIDGVPHIRPEFFAPPEVGLGGGPWLFGAILALDAIASLFGHGNAESTDTKQDREIKTLQNALAVLGINLVNTGLASFERDGRELGIQRGILGKVIGPLINAIATLFGQVHDKLLKWLGPAIKWINRIREQIRHIYDTWLRPIIRVIDAFRATLRVLEFFHIKWAEKLDTALATLERKITAPILLLNAKLTEVLNWLDRIITLDGAIQRLALLKGLIANADAALHIAWGAQLNRERQNPPRPAAKDDYPIRPASRDADNLAAFFLDDAGPIAPVAGELADTLYVALGLKAEKVQPGAG